MDNNWTNETARNYLERYGDHPLTRLWLDHMRPGPESFLIDLGCGGGAALKAAHGAEPDARLVGLDPNPVMVAAAREAMPRADIYETGAEEIPLPGGVITHALANCSISHWQDVNVGLVEVFRVLAPGGIFLIIEEAFAEIDDSAAMTSPQDLPGLLQAADFNVEDHSHHDNEGQSYWATCARKP